LLTALVAALEAEPSPVPDKADTAALTAALVAALDEPDFTELDAADAAAAAAADDAEASAPDAEAEAEAETAADAAAEDAAEADADALKGATQTLTPLTEPAEPAQGGGGFVFVDGVAGPTVSAPVRVPVTVAITSTKPFTGEPTVAPEKETDAVQKFEPFLTVIVDGDEL
jgi:hypothetical protein